MTAKRRATEDEIYDHQERVIRKRLGRRAADLANYGWAACEGPDGAVSVATKVYGHGVLTTDETLTDEWEEQDIENFAGVHA